MPAHPPEQQEFDESSVNIQWFLSLLLAMIAGLFIATLLLPTWLPNIAYSLGGDAPKVYWYLARATAFASLSLLWISMALGLTISNKMARVWPGAPAAFAIHEYISLLGLMFAAFHALILLGDHYSNFSLSQLLVPFGTVQYRPLWVGIGQIGFYVWVIVALSFYIRQRIGQKTWRVIHYLSFLMYLMGLAHGIFSGTESQTDWAYWYYWISAGSLLFLFIYRIINTIIEKITSRLKQVKQAPRPT